MLKGSLARWALVVICAGAIFLLSAQSDLPSAPDEQADFVLKKSGHFFEYTLLSILLVRALYPGGELSPRRLIVPLALAALYASSDELHQSWTAGRHPSPYDVGIDSAGALTGLIVYSWSSGRWRPRRDQSTRLRP